MNNFTITSSSNILPGNFFWKKLEQNTRLSFAEYGSWAQSLLNATKDENIISVLFLKDFVNFIDDEDLEEKLDLIKKVMKNRLNRDQGLTVFLFSSQFDTNILDTTKEYLSSNKKILNFLNQMFELSNKNNNFIFCNIDLIFSKIGYDNCFDNRNWYLARCHLSTKGLEAMSSTIEEILFKKYFSSKKLLILDCDNTLWGGVVGEDGLDGIILGQDGYGKAFEDFQKTIKNISDKGILLALLSKNSEKDVMDVFNNHNSMILKKDDIVISKINWKEKSKNILEIASELNLGLDSMVFWDDNPIEREKVKINIPDVSVVEPPKNVFDWPQHLKNLNFFSKFKITPEDSKKKEQYKIRSKFIEGKNNFESEIDYLKSIKLDPKMIEISADNIARASQLSLKTNQFNFRTIRYSESDIKKKKNESNEIIFMVSLNDLYGDHGNIALVCLKKISDKEIFLENFLMSCRVIGRYLEFWVLKKIVDKCNTLGVEKLKIEYLATKKNKMILDFLEQLPLSLSDNINKDVIQTEIDIKKFKVPNIEIFDN